MKYIKLYNSVASATSATDLKSPNVTLVRDSGDSKLLMASTTIDGDLQITGSTLAELEIGAPASKESLEGKIAVIGYVGQASIDISAGGEGNLFYDCPDDIKLKVTVPADYDGTINAYITLYFGTTPQADVYIPEYGDTETMDTIPLVSDPTLGSIYKSEGSECGSLMDIVLQFVNSSKYEDYFWWASGLRD